MSYTVGKKHDAESPIDEQYGGTWMLEDVLGCERLAFTVVELEPDRRGRKHDHSEEGDEEVYFVVEGTLDVDVGGETVRLGPDEAIRVEPGTERQITNRGERRVKVIVARA